MSETVLVFASVVATLCLLCVVGSVLWLGVNIFRKKDLKVPLIVTIITAVVFVGSSAITAVMFEPGSDEASPVAQTNGNTPVPDIPTPVATPTPNIPTPIADADPLTQAYAAKLVRAWNIFAEVHGSVDLIKGDEELRAALEAIAYNLITEGYFGNPARTQLSTEWDLVRGQEISLYDDGLTPRYFVEWLQNRVAEVEKGEFNRYSWTTLRER